MSEWVTTCNASPDWLSRDEVDSEAPRLSLTIVWSAAEPERIGETAFIDAALGERVLGRGEATLTDPSERLKFVRQRPGRLVPTSALKGDGLSRRQCLVRAERGGLAIQNCGRAAMLVDGTAQTEAHVSDGQIVTIRDQLVLYCSRQSPLPRLRSFDARQASAFGMADAHGIVGEHRAIWELRDQLAFAAESDQHVLLLGESGSGKELAAQALHQLSRRSKHALVARNAATFPSTLIDAELFGNVANYPNAGMPARTGIIGEADGSTLFLDEMAELPPEMQAHLLRVLDRGGEYQRLGDAQVRRSDFRLVAATNRDPTDLRIDILGRLTLQVQLPALVDRVLDIPLLVRHLLLRAANASPQLRDRFFVESADGPQPRVDPDLIERLLCHKFTYNIRELDSALWKAIADSPRNFVMLTRGLREQLEARSAAAANDGATNVAAEPSAQEIIDGLNRNANHVARTAEALGLSSRYALYRLMRKHGIVVERAIDAAQRS